MTCGDTDRHRSLCGIYGCADEIDDVAAQARTSPLGRRAHTMSARVTFDATRRQSWAAVARHEIGLSYGEMARRLGVTRERVRQLVTMYDYKWRRAQRRFERLDPPLPNGELARWLQVAEALSELRERSCHGA